jgi:hypothetical protein
VAHGFLRDATGTITGFDSSGSVGTYATGVNSSGQIVGYYLDGNYDPHGFERAKNGTIHTFDPSGSNGTFGQTADTGRLDDRAVIGFYDDGNFPVHGFMRIRRFPSSN